MPVLRCQGAAGRLFGSRYAAHLLLLSGFVALSFVGPANAGDVATGRTTDPFAAPIAEASRRFGIPDGWIRAVLSAESGGDTQAISPKGAMGLMQVMPATWEELRMRYRLGIDPFDPRDNILAGTAYLRALHDRYGSVAAMLAAYNAGPERYDRHLAHGLPLPDETQAYVAALAPRIGSEALSGGAPIASARPAEWREAPLFVVSSGHTEAAARLRSGGALGDPSTAASERRRTAAEPETGGLFVVANARGDQQ